MAPPAYVAPEQPDQTVPPPYMAPPVEPPADGGGIDDLEARLRALEGK